MQSKLTVNQIRKNNCLISGTDPIQLIDYCLTDLAEKAQGMLSRLNERAFIIVPEALKADLERRYLENYQVDGLMLAEVLSFSRLAHRIFSIAGGLATETISRLGKSLIIQRLIYDNSTKFKHFQRFAGLPGYSAELEKVLTDFKRFDLDSLTLDNLAEIAPPSLTKDKLHDFAVLQNLYREKMQDLSLLDQDDNLDRLAALLEDASWQAELAFLDQTRIWITGFSDIRTFNQQELKIIRLLADRVKDLKITLCTELNPGNPIGRELFQPGYQSYWQLKELLPAAELIVLDEQLSPERKALRNSFLTGTLQPESESVQIGKPDFEQFVLLAAEDKRQEWSFIAGEIKRLLTEKKYRKKEIGIVVCDNSNDLSLEKSVFREFGLETFLSDRIPIRQTALYRYLAGLFELSTNDFNLNHLLAFLRSGLAKPTEAETDKFENICLEYGLNDARKIQSAKSYDRIKSDTAKEWALNFKENYLANIFENLKQMRQLRRGEEKARYLLGWISEDSFLNKLQMMIDNLRESGEENIALSLARSWELIIQLLEESVLLLGKSRITQKGFSDVILGTLSGQIPSSIPVGLDRIRVGSPLEMMYYDCKVLFIAGATRKYFPPAISAEGFLHQAEINWIELHSEKTLPDYKTNQLLAGQVTSVLNLTISQERVYLSVPQIDQTEWSEIFVLLQDQLTQKTKFAQNINLSSITLGDPLDPDQRWLTEARTKRYLLANRRESQDFLENELVRTQITPESHPDFRLPREKTYWQVALSQVKDQAQIADLKADPLDQVKPYIYLEPTLAEQISHSKEYSVSGLEIFQDCPYQYFATYSLGLRERPVWDLDPRDRGTLIHSMMEMALRTLENKLSQISDSEYRKLEFGNWLAEIQTNSYYDQLYQEGIRATGVDTYADRAIVAAQGKRIKRHVRAALWYNATIIAPDGFFPRVFEWTFPPKAEQSLLGEVSDRERLPDDLLASWRTIDLSFGDQEIALRGIIDRIDLNDAAQYRIYDYKTGNKQLDANLIYLGLDLQLGLYQKIWQLNHPEQQANKIAYLQFNNRPRERSGARNLFSPPSDDLLTRLTANNPIQEINSQNPDVLNAVGEHATEQAKSAIKNIHRGAVSPIPKAIKPEDLPCRYCEYQEMCRYDVRLIEKRADLLEVPEQNVLEQMLEKYKNKLKAKEQNLNS